MKKKSSVISKIGTIMFIIIVVFMLWQLYGLYKRHYYNGFTKAEIKEGITKFVRDKEIKYSKADSYKIESETYNDAMFFKEIEVKPNTPYRVRVMVKTENVERENAKTNGGAQICIADTVESSEGIVGTNDWQELEFIFNSKNREAVQIGFRLGGNKASAKGTVWFSDFILEEGYKEESNEWKVGCFIFRNLEVNVETETGIEYVKETVSDLEINNIKNSIERFKYSCQQLSNNQMKVDYDIYEITEPISSISYSEEFKYYVDPVDVKDQVKPYLTDKEYDHIFIVVRLGELNKGLDESAEQWIGLGGMDLNDVGFSNIRLPEDRNSYTYVYSPGINEFPEDVLLHEFLHSLERILIEHGYEIPALHDNKDYGYEEERVIGFKEWYAKYMTKAIMDQNKNEYVGLDPIVYTLKPAHKSDFDYAIEREFNKEPEGIVEEISMVFKVIKNTFTGQPV